MTTAFISEGIWSELTKAAKACRGQALVAVAYFGKGAAKLLPLPKRSWLVVDASKANVKRGATCPADLLKLHKTGVRVFHAPNLHAKVYVFGKAAFIGSANVSKHSSTLTEALVRTTDRKVTAAARQFVSGLCLQAMGPRELEKLASLYREPKFQGGTKTISALHKQLPYAPMHLVNLEIKDPPMGSASTERAGRKEAKQKRIDKLTAGLEDFHVLDDSVFPEGETVAQVVTEESGKVYVSPPGQVLHTRKWSNGKQRCTFVYLEVPNRKRISLVRIAKRLGVKKSRLQRDGRVNQELARKIRQAWQ